VSLVGQWIAEAQAKLNGSLRMHMCECRLFPSMYCVGTCASGALAVSTHV